MNKLTKAGLAAGCAAAMVVAGFSAGGAVADSAGNTTPDAHGSSSMRLTHAQRVFAAVHADGTEGRGRGFLSSKETSTGVYTVKFDRNITKCIWQGTIGKGNFEGDSGPGEISITGRNGTKNGLFVTTFDSTGAPKDLPFLALVVCS
jgi:hypothetical protein